MKQVITSESKPIKLWLDDIEDGALQQAKNLANLPFTFRWVSIMPDSHQGYGMPIGGVLATQGVVIPNCVGVDIACGMAALQTDIPASSVTIDQIKKVMGDIRGRVPVGFSHHEVPQGWEGFGDAPDIPVVRDQLKSARCQLGTLGGGNHFLELQKGNDGLVWIMVHSGSRNIGFKIAHEYHEKAKKLCARWYSELPDKELAFLPIEDPVAKEYMEAMVFAMKFAYANRDHMMRSAKAALKVVFGPVGYNTQVNIHHNYAVWEHHFGHNVIVHRKGATSAKKEQLGIIPGSQGTKSYIVRGLGNPDSFESCSHGAGRKMGRKQAQRELDLATEQKRLDDLGIVHSVRNESDLDEAAGAYKDIGEVMSNQADLVDIVVELSPLAVIKA